MRFNCNFVDDFLMARARRKLAGILGTHRRFVWWPVLEPKSRKCVWLETVSVRSFVRTWDKGNGTQRKSLMFQNLWITAFANTGPENWTFTHM